MLDQHDLELIQKLNQESEQRMMAYSQQLHQESEERRKESEQRMTEQINKLNQESEQRMMAYAQKLSQESEQRMMVLMEAYFDPKFQALSDSIALLTERKASTEVMEDLDDRVTYLEGAVETNTKDIILLKQAK